MVRKLMLAAAAASLVLLGASQVPAGAAPAPAPPAGARVVVPNTADPEEFEQYGTTDYINGSTHNDQLLVNSRSVTKYYLYSQGGGWYTISAGGLCWNAIPTTLAVVMSSCVSGDQLEYWAFIEYPNGSYAIRNQQLSSYWAINNRGFLGVTYNLATAFIRIAV